MTFNDRISYRALTAFLAQFANARNHVRPGFEELLFRQTKLVSAGYVLSNICSWRSVASVAHTVSQWPIRLMWWWVKCSTEKTRLNSPYIASHSSTWCTCVRCVTIRPDATCYHSIAKITMNHWCKTFIVTDEWRLRTSFDNQASDETRWLSYVIFKTQFIELTVGSDHGDDDRRGGTGTLYEYRRQNADHQAADWILQQLTVRKRLTYNRCSNHIYWKTIMGNLWLWMS